LPIGLTSGDASQTGVAMRKCTVLLAAMLATALSATASAQMGPGGGMGGMGGMGDGRGGHHHEEGEEGEAHGGGRPQVMQTLKRKQLDDPVTAMFRAADADHDGIVTLAELKSVIAARRDAMIRARFEQIDTNHDHHIDLEEFLAWQRQLGSVASSEAQSVLAGPVAEAIEPSLGGSPRDDMLRAIIAPLNAMTIVDANTNYDAGVSLEELLAFERKRFDAADTDGDGELTFEEIRAFNRKNARSAPSLAPDGPPDGPDGPPSFRHRRGP